MTGEVGKVVLDVSKTAIQVFHQARIFIQDAASGEVLESIEHLNVAKDATKWAQENGMYILGNSISPPSYRTLTAVGGRDLTGKSAYIVEVMLSVWAAPMATDTRFLEVMPNGRPGAALDDTGTVGGLDPAAATAGGTASASAVPAARTAPAAVIAGDIPNVV